MMTMREIRNRLHIVRTERDDANNDLLVYIEGERRPVRMALWFAPHNSAVTHDQLDFIAKELETRRRNRLFVDARHDHFRGFRA